MTMVAVLPFRANKRFILDGQQVLPGEIVDVSMLAVDRVVRMERGNYGLRVAAEVSHEVQERPSPADATARASVGEAHEAVEDDEFFLDVEDEVQPVAVEDDVPAAVKPRASTRKR